MTFDAEKTGGLRVCRNALLLGGIVLAAGCEGDSGSQPAAPAAGPPAHSASGPVVPIAVEAPPVPEAEEDGSAEAATTVQAASEPGAIVSQREQAAVGAGKKGRGYGGGIYTEPIRQKFRAEQAIAFNIQIPHGMKTFKAIHNRAPKDFAEFKREILEPANISLPELPAGDRYIYDAKEEELMVEHTVPAASAKEDK